MKYREEIDGLRAIAVVPVVLFHAGLEGFSGGFVGVDIFFVISGFLITSLIHEEIEAGEFSIVRFYERRIRRIFPALFAVVLFCFVVGAWLFMPFDFRRFAQSAVAITVFGSNFLFWFQSGYFDSDSSLKPLLHTWSLAVEEQFYVFFPIILLLAFAWLRRRCILVVAILALASLLFGVWQVASHPSAAFFLPASRAWELLTGSLLALWRPQTSFPASVKNLVGLAGALLIVSSILTFSETTPFPGASALLPCVGAAAAIYAGRASIVGQLLSTVPMVFVGKISYSLYMWHWPLIVFVKYYLMRSLGPWETAFLIFAIFVISTLSWRFVELPFRARNGDKRPTLLRNALLFGGAGTVMVASVAIGLFVYLTQGAPLRLPKEVQSIAMGAFDTKLGKSRCDEISLTDISTRGVCEIGDSQANSLSFVVFGDSIATSMLPAIESVAADLGLRGKVLTRGGCYPLADIEQSNNASCAPFTAASINFINENSSIKSVIIAARWAAAAYGTRSGATTASRMYVTDRISKEMSYEENRRVLPRALAETLRAIPSKQVQLLFGVPEQQHNVPRVAALVRYLKRDPAIDLTRSQYESRQKIVAEFVAPLASRRVSIVDLGRELCNEKVCPATKDLRSLYSDDNHLSSFGAMQLRGLFERSLGAPTSAADSRSPSL